MHTKTCPRCGQQLFDDMPICYECLYEFAVQDEIVPIRAYEEGEVRQQQDHAGELRIHIATPSADLALPVPEDGLVVGRGSACDVVLHTPAVSRRHVRLEPREGGVLVTNLGARNPATLQDEAVMESTLMEKGEVLNVCGSLFWIEADGET